MVEGGSRMTRSPRLLAVFVSLWLSAPLSAEALFLRGNSNGDDRIDIADPIHTLTYLFLGGDSPDCIDAADSNDSGGVDISDPVYTLGYLFLGGPEPPAPGPDIAGSDPTGDPLDCPGATAFVLESVELHDADANGSIDRASLRMSEPIDPVELPPAGSFAIASTPPGSAFQVLAGSEISASGDELEVRFGSGIGKTDIQDVEVRIAAPAPVRPA